MQDLCICIYFLPHACRSMHIYSHHTQDSFTCFLSPACRSIHIYFTCSLPRACRSIHIYSQHTQDCFTCFLPHACRSIYLYSQHTQDCFTCFLPHACRSIYPYSQHTQDCFTCFLPHAYRSIHFYSQHTQDCFTCFLPHACRSIYPYSQNASAVCMIFAAWLSPTACTLLHFCSLTHGCRLPDTLTCNSASVLLIYFLVLHTCNKSSNSISRMIVLTSKSLLCGALSSLDASSGLDALSMSCMAFLVWCCDNWVSCL